MRWVSQCVRAWQNAFRGQARSYRRLIALRGSSRVRGHLASWMAACGGGGGGPSPAGCGEGEGCNVTGCLHTFVGARLPANALGQSMHQCLAEMHFAGKRAPTGDQFRFRVPGGAGHDPDQALLRWVSLVANWPGSDRPPRITPQVLYHEPTFILRAASLVPDEARCDERFATHRHPARV
jgi:hypothetical protein